MATHHGHARLRAGIHEEAGADLAIERAVAHVGDEHVEQTIAIQVRDERPHVRHALPAFAEGHAHLHRFIGKVALAIVYPKVIGPRIVRHKNVRVAVSIKVAGDRAHAAT